MRLLRLDLTNIGPFDHASIEFMDEEGRSPVTLITGENGAGKSIILDAIRGMFGPQYCAVERPIWRPQTPLVIDLLLTAGSDRFALRSDSATGNGLNVIDTSSLSNLPIRVQTGQAPAPNWVVDFWRSSLATDSYEVSGLARLNHRDYLLQSLQGTYRNAAVTELICHFDYLRDSRDERERRDGEVLYQTTKKIIKASLLDGELSHVARANFTPMVRQSGQLVPLANVSSGNAYLIHHMISMLGKMYSLHVLRNTPPEEMCHVPGLLLIDEAENHLHPRWQKHFIPGILDVFPNLQIIATTHSPFILSSVSNARVYVCRYDGKRSVVTEETDAYVNKPVEEILLSPAFDGTQPFSTEITQLLEDRKRAVEAGDHEARARIEAELKEKNPDYFSYLDIDARIEALGKGEPPR